jgi:hypothetical protein
LIPNEHIQMNRPSKHPSVDLNVEIEWRKGSPYYKGRLMRYDYVAARLAASGRRIEELLGILALLNQKAAETEPQQVTVALLSQDKGEG